MPKPIQLHSDQAELMMLDPYWLPGWTLDKITEPDGEVSWEVVVGLHAYGRKVLSKAASDVAAIQEALRLYGKGNE